MKEIKFKAWDKKKNEWIKVKSGGMSLNYKTGKLEYTYSDTFDLQDWETLRMIGAFPGDYNIVEYTGLKDKNSKEIYIGYIVEVKAKGSIMEIKFENGCFRGFDHDMKTKILIELFAEECEVIGNMFENKDLLNKDLLK